MQSYPCRGCEWLFTIKQCQRDRYSRVRRLSVDCEWGLTIMWADTYLMVRLTTLHYRLWTAVHNQEIPLLRLLCARHRRRADCEWWRTANVVGAVMRLIGGVSDY